MPDDRIGPKRERSDLLRWAEDYVAQLRTQAWSDERIADLFLEAGWSTEDLTLLGIGPGREPGPHPGRDVPPGPQRPAPPAPADDAPALSGWSVLWGCAVALLGGLDFLIALAAVDAVSRRSRIGPLGRGLLAVAILLGLWGILWLCFVAPR